MCTLCGGLVRFITQISPLGDLAICRSKLSSIVRRSSVIPGNIRGKLHASLRPDIAWCDDRDAAKGMQRQRVQIERAFRAAAG
jgi:hypothetical protein